MNPLRFVNFSVLLQCLVIVIPLLEVQGANAGVGAYGHVQSQALGQTQEQHSPGGTHLVPVKRNIPAQYQQRSRAGALAPQGKGNNGAVDVGAHKKRCEGDGCDDEDDWSFPPRDPSEDEDDWSFPPREPSEDEDDWSFPPREPSEDEDDWSLPPRDPTEDDRSIGGNTRGVVGRRNRGSGKGIMCKCVCDGLPIDADAGSSARA